MAAQKEQRKAVVGLLGRLGGLHRFLADSRGHLPVTAGLVAAEQVDHSPVANPDQPAARVLRHPFVGHRCTAASSVSWTASSATSK